MMLCFFSPNKTVYSESSINNRNIINSEIIVDSGTEPSGLFGQLTNYFIVTENSEKTRNKHIVSENLYINIDKNDTIDFYNGYNENDSTKIKELFIKLNKSTIDAEIKPNI